MADSLSISNSNASNMIRKIIYKIKEDRLYTFLFRSLLIIATIITLDILIGNALDKIYFKQNHQADFMTTYAMEQNQAELLVFGASSANHHYNPESFKKTGMTFRNCGRDGNFIFYHYAILKSTLKRYKPKLIILDITEEDFYKSPDSYDRLSSLLPYYKTHPEIREIVELRGRWEKIKLLSHIYPFNSKVISSLTGFLDIHHKRDEEILNMGYVPLYNDWSKPLAAFPEKKSEFDKNKVEIFNRFISDCKNANVRLIIVASPSYRKIDYKRKYIQLIEETAKNDNILFWDFTNAEPFISTQGFFADMVHLNYKGANYFSDMIAGKIMETVNKL